MSWGPSQVKPIVVEDDEDQQAAAASLATFAQEEMVRRMQAQMDAQSKQMRAQAQLTLQSRQQVAALEEQLRKAGGQQQGGQAASAKPQQQPAPIATAVQQQGTSALDMILNGPAGSKPGVQPALAIWSEAGKKKIEQALKKLDAVAFKAVHSLTKMDGGTPDARFVVQAFPQDVAVVQTLLLPLVAAGMRAEFYDPAAVSPSSAPSWSQVATGAKPKAAKKSKLAGQAQAGLSTAIAKAGKTGKRVHGQCDYFSASLTCPRGPDCRFICYNGPGKP